MKVPKDYRQQIFAHWGLLKHLARRRFLDPDVADEALSYVLDKLAENDWSRIRQYRGQARFDTYLSHITYRLLEDFARHKFGRHRIPDWLKAQGGLWEQVYRLLCLERRPIAEVVEILRMAVPGGRDPQMIRRAAAVIRSRISDCGSPSLPERGEPFEGAGSRERQAHELSPEDLLAAQQEAKLLEIISRIVFGEGVQVDASATIETELQQAVQRFQAALRLTRTYALTTGWNCELRFSM
jgi:hypothetical protein